MYYIGFSSNTAQELHGEYVWLVTNNFDTQCMLLWKKWKIKPDFFT